MKLLKLQNNVLLFILLFLSASCRTYNLDEKGLVTDKAMVVTAHPFASKAGVEILLKGGNAIDAAIAVEFALAVVYPEAGNIGGGGFMIIRLKDGETDALDYREKAPAAASRNMYLNEEGELIEDLSVKGHLGAGVPGTVDGMVKAHEKYGSLPWEVLVQPAIDLAEEGFPLTEKEAEKLNEYQGEFIKYSTTRPDFILKDDWEEGDTIRMKSLAETLTLIRNNKRAGFYDGLTAKRIVAEMNRGNGIISMEDLANYHSVWREPVTGSFKEKFRVISMPPPSAGGIGLIQLLKITEDYPLDEWGWNSTKAVHLMTEAERRVYADRAVHLADPAYYDVPREELQKKEYLRKRMKGFSPDDATRSKDVNPGKPLDNESPKTTHYSIVDQYGNAVSVTTTLNSSFGSKVIVGEAGFFINNQMNDFSIKPGEPNQYGVVHGEANTIEPGKRMLSSMTPTIVEKNDSLFMVVGTPGGPTIITTIYQTVLNVTVHDMPMQGAVNAPRFHHQWKPDWILAELGSFNLGTSLKLWWMGHRIVPAIYGIGRTEAIRVLPDGKLEGGADPRGDDTAAGF